jgi:hypothetical protein
MDVLRGSLEGMSKILECALGVGESELVEYMSAMGHPGLGTIIRQYAEGADKGFDWAI